MKVFVNKERIQVYAVGEYNPETGELVVLKGSKVSPDISNSAKFRSASSIVKQRENTVVDNVTIQDITFKSPSTAGNFVTGRSTNGYVTWCDASGKKLKEILGR